MADLTARMPLTEGTNRVLDDPASPSMLGALAGFAGNALNDFADLRRQMASDKASKAAADAKKREADASLAAIRAPTEAVDLVNTSYSRAEAFNQTGNGSEDLSGIGAIAKDAGDSTGVFTDNKATVDPNVTKTIQRIGSEVQNVSAAVEQGAMPPISLSAALNGKFNQLINQFPDQAEHILDVWKKMGIDTTLFRPARDLASDEDFAVAQRHAQESDDRQFQQKMFETGMAAVGETAATGGANGGPMTREEVIAHGIAATRQGTQLDLALKGISLAQQQANLTAAQRAELQGQKDDVIAQSFRNALYNGATPVIQMVKNLANSIMKEPDPTKQAERWQANGVRLHAMVTSEIEHAVQLASAKGYSQDKIDALRTSLTAQFKQLDDLYTGDFAVAQVHIKALQTIEAKLKIDGGEALPVYTTLRSLGMDPTTMTGFINGMAENSELTTSLRNEIKGFNTDFGKEKTSTHIANIVRILRGEATLANMSPQEARAKMPDLFNTSISLSKDYAEGKGTDPEMVMNGIGELSVAANTLAPTSGAASHGFAIAGTLGVPQVRALQKLSHEKGVDSAMVTATIQAARATGAHVLNNFQAVRGKLNEQSPYNKIVWDDRNGRYRIDDSLARKAAVPSRTSTGAGAMPAGVVVSPGRMGQMSRPTNLKAPAEMQTWVKTANMALDGVMSLKDLDPTTPKGTDLELRRYYGENIAPASMKNDSKPIDVGSEIDKQFTAIESTLDKSLTAADTPVQLSNGSVSVKGVKGQTVTIPPTEQIHEQNKDNPIYNGVVSAAREAGVPVDVAIRLVHLESKFGNPGPNGSNARGPMQVVDFSKKTGKDIHDGESMQMFGKHVADLTPDENIKLGMTILSNNIKRLGIRGGIKAYLGTGNDGNVTADQYADLILGGDISDVDGSGAMPIGQQTPYGVRY